MSTQMATLAVIAIITVSAIAAEVAMERAQLAALKTGAATLVCVFSDGERVVEPSRIVGRDDNGWVFTNGSAKSCKLKKGGL